MIGTLLLCASLFAVDGDTIKCDGVNMRDMGDGASGLSASRSLLWNVHAFSAGLESSPIALAP